MPPPLHASNDDEVVAEMRRRLAPWGEVGRVAVEYGLSVGHLKSIKYGERPPTETVARIFGFRRVVYWERIRPGPEGR